MGTFLCNALLLQKMFSGPCDAQVDPDACNSNVDMTGVTAAAASEYLSPGPTVDTCLRAPDSLIPDIVVSFCSRGFKRLLGSHLKQRINIAFALLPGILVTWSPEGIGTGIRASLVQSYPILLSALSTIGRHQLSYNDVQYALTVTSPPLMVYLIVSSACDLFGMKTSIYKRIQSYRRTTRAFRILILPLCRLC